MQPTTRVHHGITKALLPETDGVLHHPLALHPTNGGFQADSDGGTTAIGRVLRRRAFPARRGFLRVEEREARQETSLDALLLIQAPAGGPGRAGQRGHALISGLSCTAGAPEAKVPGLVDHAAVGARGTRLLAPVIFWLVLGLLRAVEGACGPLRQTRAIGGPAAVRFAASSGAQAAAVRAGSPSWWARA